MIHSIAAACLLALSTAAPQDPAKGGEEKKAQAEGRAAPSGSVAARGQQSPPPAQNAPAQNPANPAPARPTPAPAPASQTPAPVTPPQAGTGQAGGAGGQGGARIAPIQDAGNEYILTFDESGEPDALNLEQFVKICQTTTGMNFTYTKETSQLLQQTKLRMFGQKRIPKTDFYSFFQIMMIINDFVCSKIGPDHLAVIVISSMSQGAQRGGSLRNEAVYVFADDIDRYADQPATLVTTVIDLPNTDVRLRSSRCCASSTRRPGTPGPSRRSSR
jgi:hypothetical protein